MRKPVPSMIAALAVALVTVSTAAAITGGGVDGGAHPYVGALVVDGSVQCSGVLVAPTVFATAGHCGADGSRVSVSFDSKLDAGWSLVGGTLQVDSAKGADLAVVVLDAPASVAPATLPTAGSAGLLAQGGTPDERRLRVLEPSGRRELRLRRPPPRRELPVTKVSKSMVGLSTSTAGPCLGDSGGPQLSGNTVLSLTSTGSKDCAGKAEGYRLDTQSAREFLSGFVALP